MSIGENMSDERGELEQVVRDAYVENCMQLATRDLTELMADAILAAGYRKPAKVKGNTPLGKIRELFKHLDSWESQEHTTVGIDYLRRHFKDAA